MGYKKSNPLKMMGSALKMYKAEKKGGMHRMESPMYAEAGSSKGMPRLEDRVQRRQDKVDASRATFGTDNVDGGFDRKLKRLKKSVAKSEDRGMNLNYDTTNASGEGYSRETVALNRESSELKDMPIVDIEKGDAEGSPAMNYDTNKGSHSHPHGSPAKMTSPLNDRLDRKKKKADKTAVQIRDMQNERSSVKTEWEDTDSGPKTRDVEVRTADKPASKREKRKFKKLKKTTKQIGSMYHEDLHGGMGSPAKNQNQGYNDKLDESLAKDGNESTKKQSLKDRRDESKGMEKSKGKGAYSSDPKMK